MIFFNLMRLLYYYCAIIDTKQFINKFIISYNINPAQSKDDTKNNNHEIECKNMI
jgi:hypothetical protein